MNILADIWGKVKNFIFPQAAAGRVFSVKPVVSQSMERNINLWYAMYVNQPPWMDSRVKPLGTPSAICRELARPALSELVVNITGSARANYLNENFQAVRENFLQSLEMGLAVGGIAFKPYPYGDKILVDATSASAFRPTKYAADGQCIGGVFRERLMSDGKWYARLEYHDLEGTDYTIQNKAFLSDSSGSVGAGISLQDVKEWANIQPEIHIANLTGPLFAYFKPPQRNNVEIDSNAGMSIYGGAVVDLIKQADEQWELIQWEYRSGQRKVLMDGTSTRAKDFDNRLFEIGPFTSGGSFYQQFEPVFRDDALYRGLQNILKQIEFQVGMSYGTLSDPQSVEKTATEIRNSKQRMYITIDSIQKALQHTFDGLLYAMDVYAGLYNLAPAGGYEASYDWGDSILEDADAKERERANDRQDLAAGILNDWEYRAKWYNETEDEAKAALPKAQDMVDEEQEEVE